MALKPALYHRPDGLPAWTLFVKTENKDGTVELVNEADELKVGKCPVATEPTVGHCTLSGAAPAEAEGDKQKTLDELTKKDLFEMIEQLNLDVTRKTPIVLTGKETKADLIALIEKDAAEGPTS